MRRYNWRTRWMLWRGSRQDAYKRNPSERTKDQQRLAAIAVSMLLVGGAFGYKAVTGTWPIIEQRQSAQVVQPPLTQNGKVQPTTLQAVRQRFGPWSLQLTPATTGHEQLVMLLESGAIDVSHKRVDFDPVEWTSQKPFQLRNVSVQHGQVVIDTDEDKVFTVAIKQPFVLEQFPEQVHLVTSDGTLWSTDSTSVSIHES